jgi:hypothetical protein
VRLNELMNSFRLATRELFNHYFLVPGARDDNAWRVVERFGEVQEVMFRTLVTGPASLPTIRYGDIQPEILVELRERLDRAPVLLNREVQSGYWDHPLPELTRSAKLAFISFFDWDEVSYRDHQYARAQVLEWPEHPEVVGKHALIESQYVHFVRATGR